MVVNSKSYRIENVEFDIRTRKQRDTKEDKGISKE